MIEQIVTVLHVLIAISIVGLILLQQGKGADMGASFGSGGSQTLFGAPGGGNVLTRMTSVLVTLFFVTSFGLAIIAKQKVQELNGADMLIGTEQELVAPGRIDDLDEVPMGDPASEIPLEESYGDEADFVPADVINYDDADDPISQIPE